MPKPQPQPTPFSCCIWTRSPSEQL